MSFQTENRQLITLLGIGVLTAITTAIALWISPHFFVDDTDALYRFMILKIPALLWDVFVVIGSLVILDYLTPDDTLAGIAMNHQSAAILYAAVVVGVSMAIAFG